MVTLGNGILWNHLGFTITFCVRISKKFYFTQMHREAAQYEMVMDHLSKAPSTSLR